jgi:hypothetical protein
MSRGSTPEALRRPDAADCVQHPSNHPLTPAADGAAFEHGLNAIDGHQQRRHTSGAGRVDAVQRYEPRSVTGARMTDTPSLAARVDQRAGNQSSGQFLHRGGTRRDCTCCDYRSLWHPPGLMLASRMPKKKRRAGEDAGAARMGGRTKEDRFCG